MYVMFSKMYSSLTSITITQSTYIKYILTDTNIINCYLSHLSATEENITLTINCKALLTTNSSLASNVCCY
jgi:hypothetical protein